MTEKLHPNAPSTGGQHSGRCFATKGKRGLFGSLGLATLAACGTLETLSAVTASPSIVQRPRLIVLTDIGNEPDDAQSLVRLLLYSNELEIEGLIATTSRYLRNKVNPQMISDRVAAYDQVCANLSLHASGYPAGTELMQRIKSGVPLFGMAGVGATQDSEGSDWIVQMIEKPDPRPLWICIWGGPNCLAQALWHLREAQAPEAFASALARLRVYAIADQDDSGTWIRSTFPDLFYIYSDTQPNREGYRRATWAGISGDRYYGFDGADFSLVDPDWIERHIRQNRGPLGALYPRTSYIMEGDTPSFLHLIPNGLSVPDRPDFGGWGGRYRNLPNGNVWGDTADAVKGVDGQVHTSASATIWRWRNGYQNDFQARMSWCVLPFDEANHAPVVSIRQVLNHSIRSGETLRLDADASDPDGHALAFEWFIYPEAGGYGGPPIVLDGVHEPSCVLTAPQVLERREVHVILTVADNGTPPLHAYRRVIVAVLPGNAGR